MFVHDKTTLDVHLARGHVADRASHGGAWLDASVSIGGESWIVPAIGGTGERGLEAHAPSHGGASRRLDAAAERESLRNRTYPT